MKKNLFSITIILFLLSGCALNSDVIYLDQRIDKLSREISQQKSGIDKSKEQVLEKYASLANRYETLSEKIREAVGRYEELEHSLSKKDKGLASLEAQLTALNREFSFMSKKVNNIALYTGFTEKKDKGESLEKISGVDNREIVKKDNNADDLYKSAKFQFDNNKLKEAKKIFEIIVEKFPESEKADNALFWVGEIYYKEKWYQKAILEYQNVIENYPSGNKTPAAYFKQALSFEKLGEKDNADLIISELLKKFPDSKEAKLAKKRE